MRDLNQKVAVVTGAGSGIGRAVAQHLAEAGALVALNDVQPEPLAETQALIEAKGGTVLSQAFDVSDREAMYAFAETVIETFGHVDVVVNNAGVALGILSVEAVSEDELAWIFGINLWGVIHGTKAFLPHLLKRPEAALVNVSSVFGMMGIGYQVPYCTTKFAVRGFTEGLRMELTKSNITVSCVHPGGIKTNIIRNSRDRSAAAKRKLISHFERGARTTAEDAGRIIVNGIRKKKERILIGFDARQIDWMTRLWPVKYTKAYLAKLKWLKG